MRMRKAFSAFSLCLIAVEPIYLRNKVSHILSRDRVCSQYTKIYCKVSVHQPGPLSVSNHKPHLRTKQEDREPSKHANHSCNNPNYCHLDPKADRRLTPWRHNALTD